MSLFSDVPSLTDELASSYLFFDNNALIAMLEVKELLQQFIAMKESGATLLTITPVAIEFLKTDNLQNYNKRRNFLKTTISGIYSIEKHIDINDPLFFVLNKISACEYVDHLLYHTAYKFKNAYLVTENHKDFLTTILDRKHIITIDQGNKQIRNLAFYQMNTKKIDIAIHSILKS